jgi:hypothetical protein
MIENLPLYISLNFILITLVTVFIFSRASGNKIGIAIILIMWMIIQSAISMSGFYLVTHSFPPRFVLAPLPPAIIILILFLTKRGRKFVDGFNLKFLTWLHVIRIPVEITLFLLYMFKQVPQVMTFEGRNFDIISGISAIGIALLAFRGQKPKRNLLLVWNFICLGLLLNIVIIAILSAPFSIQQFGLDQPNVAVLYFPFVLLPACIVPLVLFSHLVAIRKLLKKAD